MHFYNLACGPNSWDRLYDAAGNRLSEDDGSKTISYSYNAANLLLQAGDVRYAYDANGNRINEQDGSGRKQYQYNADNFLIRFADPEGQVTEYGYDAVNRRAFKSAGKHDITSYLYDGLEVLQEVSGQNAQKIAAYYRANGRIVSQQKYNVSQGNNEAYQHRPEGRQLFYAYDGLGSVAALSNHQGQQQTRYHYDAFGKVIDGDLSENQYTFTGRQLDPESGLYHFHFRQYDSTSGVWTTADPIGIFGGMNLYGYVGNNPVNFRDFLGLSEISDVNGGYADNGGLGYNGGNDFGGGGVFDANLYGFTDFSRNPVGDLFARLNEKYGLRDYFEDQAGQGKFDPRDYNLGAKYNPYDDPVKGLIFGTRAASIVVGDTLLGLTRDVLAGMFAEFLGIGTIGQFAIDYGIKANDVLDWGNKGMAIDKAIREQRENVFGKDYGFCSGK